MKEYTTLEMIEEIMKDKKLRFKCINGIVFYKEQCPDPGVIAWESNGPFNETLEINTSTFKYKWTKVQQPVSFMDAVKAYHEGKKIKCVLDDFELIFNFDRNTTKRYGRSILGTLTTTYDYSSIATREILEGAWYIEE